MATRIREKAEARRKAKDNRPQGIAKYIRISPTKVRFVLNNIRNKKVEEALAILENSTRGASEPLIKLLKSVIANAEVKGFNRDDLILKETWVSPGPIMKRISMRAKGRSDRILKRSCHITMILDDATSGVETAKTNVNTAKTKGETARKGSKTAKDSTNKKDTTTAKTVASKKTEKVEKSEPVSEKVVATKKVGTATEPVTEKATTTKKETATEK
ncbi:MAG: 50S ribosomal protein L22 [Clostridia bacterium]|jgi:large subunit ribosomal protein L22|nr:50S ribosomal protein L22 [Clostridia bacterium]MDD3231864.1 50S ribosomal protein L22 [Clostridia bacterium]MDD3862386.1 50S ribosomal protein L22 [Clostridia bacterium]MDD4408467.1 50S ribosomal protein L22 [Clostridia bacterium]